MQIEIFELLELTIETSEGPVNRNAFEKWADDNEKRIYETNISDHCGNHCQTEAIMEWENYYWCSPHPECDIAEFLQYQHRNPTNVFLTSK